MSDDAFEKHLNSLARLERSAELTRERQEEAANRKERLRTNAAIVEGDNAKELMELQHELNIQNRALDHKFNMAEDTRELERQALEVIIRRRNDFIRHHWEMEQQILDLELRMIEKQVAVKAEKSLSTQKHQEAKDLASHSAELEKDIFTFKETVGIKLRSLSGKLEAETVTKHVQSLLKSGKISE